MPLQKLAGFEPREGAVILALMIIFLSGALVNMGALAIPAASVWPANAEAVFDLGEVQEVKELYVFLNDAQRTQFTVYHGAPPDEWRTLAVFDRDPANHVHFSSWERLSLPATSTRYLKIVFTAASTGEVGEILVISAANEIVPVAVTGDSGTERLADEHELITLPITQKYGAYFDEMYFVRTAEEHLNLEEPYEWTHPPLGKLIIAAGIASFGMSPFGWRILGVIAATAMIPLIFVFGKRLFKSALAGFFAAFLLTFDFLHFTLARLAIGEIYLLLFSILMFYFAFDYFEKRANALVTTAEAQNSRAAHSLFLALLCFGLCFAVKWIAIFGLVAVLILLLINNRRLNQPLLRDARVVLAGLCAAVAIYIAAYIPYMLSGEGHGLIDLHHLPVYLGYLSEYLTQGTITVLPTDSLTFFDLQLRMFGYHAGIEATHPYSSPWWSWPLLLKPLWLYANWFDGMVSTIVLMGNPVLWWGSIPALTALGIILIRTVLKRRADERTFPLLFILIPFLIQWLGFIFISRILFIYHFTANLPFLVFAVTYWLQLPFAREWQTKRAKRIALCLVVLFLVLTVVLFFLFYPVISGYPVSYEYKESLRWLDGWVF
ncbi:MAG TPA: phospholipid carrier-dependent glycosyltransferase [Methanomicrobia archaeon]|nr:phospholipid carrier-dependent glycosyltransferase [Methanomicrobia archaeon]